MTKATRLKYALAAPVFVLATIVTQFSSVATVSAAPVTWDGDAGDGLFSTAANWSNDTVPTNGDTLIFNASSIGSSAMSVTNDLANFTASGITVSGNGTGYGTLVINGNDITLTGNISNTATYNGSPKLLDFNAGIILGANISSTGAVDFETINVGTRTLSLTSPSNTCGVQIGVLSGSGTVNISGTGYSTTGTSPFTGSINVSQGSLVVRTPAALTNVAGITTSGSGSLTLGAFENNTYTMPVTLGGSGRIVANQNTSGCSGSTPIEVYTTTLSGPVTLNSDYKFFGENNLKITGTYTANGHNFTVEQGSIGGLTTPQGTLEPQPFTTQLDGSQPNAWVNVANKETAYLNGTRGSISIAAGGLLKGTGTVEVLYNDAGGVLNPGNSPGKMTVLDAYFQSGTYQVEIQNKDLYDQLVVGAETSDDDTVTLQTGAKLDVQLFGDWDIKNGDTFKVIDNLSSNPVQGTFDGLAEGAQFVVNGVTFSISYVGGDGNDVVLTSHTTVTAPNTGVLQAVKSNPAIVAVLGIASAVAIMALALRRKTNR